MACHCDDFSKAQAGRGLRGIEPGMPTPAGTGLSRRAFLARSSGLALSVFGGVAAVAAGVRGGHRGRAVRPPSARARLDLPLRRPRLDVGARPDRRPPLRVAAARPQADPERQRRRRLHRGRPAALAPERRAAARPAPRREGLGDAGHRLQRAQPVALHLAPLLGGRARSTRSGRIGWLGRYLDKHGVDDNPLQGLSLDYNLAPALAAAERAGRGRLLARSTSRSARATSGTTASARRLVEALQRARARLATDDAELRSARRAATQTVGLRGQLAPLQGTDAPWQTAVAVPERGRLRAPAGGARGDARARPAAEGRRARRQRRLRHARQPERLAARRPRAVLAVARGLPGRPRGARPRRPRADQRLERVRPPARRRTAAAPTTARPASRWSSAPGPRARWSASSPASRSSTRDDNLRNTTDFRAVYCSLLEQWLGVDAAGIIPKRLVLRAPGAGRLSVEFRSAAH